MKIMLFSTPGPEMGELLAHGLSVFELFWTPSMYLKEHWLKQSTRHHSKEEWSFQWPDELC